MSLKVRSLVGIAPLFAVCIMKRGTVEGLKDFEKRTNWFLKLQRTALGVCQYSRLSQRRDQRLEVDCHRAARPIPTYSAAGPSMSQSSSPPTASVHCHGIIVRIRSKSIFGDSTSRFATRRRKEIVACSGATVTGGDPVWFPMNMLLINALERYSLVYGDDFKLEYPTGSGERLTLVEIAEDIARRLINLFLPDKDGHRPSHGGEERYATDPHWKDLIIFSEYFDGDTGRGLGASHQTGWTALAATLIQALYTRREIRNRAQ